jgi:hypothetical protein
MAKGILLDMVLGADQFLEALLGLVRQPGFDRIHGSVSAQIYFSRGDAYDEENKNMKVHQNLIRRF